MTSAEKAKAIHLVINEKLSYTQAAKIMECSNGTIGKIFRRYCTATTIRILEIRPEKKAMAALVSKVARQAREEPPTEAKFGEVG